MPITCITGTPGAGKTLSALEEFFKELGINPRGKSVDDLRHEMQNNATRPAFVCNVRGLVPGLFEEIPDPWGWEDLPDGSLVLVDEAWEFFGRHLRNNDDPRILNFAKHRHRGFDFIFTTQAPNQLAPFIRELLGRHIHVTRKFGTQTTIRYEWPHVQESPNGQTAKAHAQEQVWQYPKEVFALYESATLHTVKRKIPKKIIGALVMGALGAIVLPVALVYQVSTLTPDELTEAATVAEDLQTGAHSVASTPVQIDGEEVLTLEQYAFLRTPRIDADPASAPLYDHFEVQDYPRMFCVITGDQRVERISCRCRTQQMTPVLVNDRVCIHAARYGVWDPRLRPVGYAPREAGQQEMPQSLQDASTQQDSGPVGIGAGIDRSTLQPYTPPDFTSR
jgi:hypothetical protein